MRVGIFNFSVFRSSNPQEGLAALTLIILARITKRAQIPFSAWLPAAMAAPTPVSALVHSSTLVTAGVYLIIRFNVYITEGNMSKMLLILGLITTLMAGASALFELDIKKVIALSTLRQLGVIFFRLGLRYPFLAFFHLISHAYFKAMLFIAAGTIIHRLKDYQDFRKMGRSLHPSILLSSIMLVANLRLCGFPFLSGFYSKDLILEVFMCGGTSIALYFIMLVATVLTLIYSARFSIFLFLLLSGRESIRSESDRSSFIMIGASALLIPSVAGGYWLSGMLPSPPLIIMPTFEKLLIISLLLITGFIMLISPRNSILRGMGGGVLRII